jgi:dTDP-4-dehydrorhamnose 3,5-epimerase
VKVIPCRSLEEVLMIAPDVWRDGRGFFLETWREESYMKFGIPPFVQDNYSLSKNRVLRGLHYQVFNPQGKLVYVTDGEIYDVAVDIRKGSPTFGKWTGDTLSSENNHQLYIPPGFAHGFLVRSEYAAVSYKCTDYYNSASERGIRWNDPSISIDWGVTDPVVSEKDSNLPLFAQISEQDLPEYSKFRVAR